MVNYVCLDLNLIKPIVIVRETLTKLSGSKLFKLWRILATGFSFALFGFGALVLGLLFAIFVYPLPLDRQTKQAWTRNSMRGLLWLYIRIMRILGLLSYEIDPALGAKTSGRLFIANHPTLLDVVFIISTVPDMNCIVKSALWRNPFTFAVVSMAGFIRNDTEDLIEVAADSLRSGQNLIIFPEGTRTVDLHQLNFKRGVAHIAIAAGCAIKPIFIRCQPITLRKHEKWYQVPATPPRFSLRGLTELQIDQCIDISRPKPLQVRHLTRYLQSYFQDLVNKYQNTHS